MKLTKIFHLKPTSTQQIILGHLTYSVSKLWNVCNYARRNSGSGSNSSDGDSNSNSNSNKFKFQSAYEQQKEFKDNFWYKNLPSQSAQAVIEKLANAWKAFFYAKKSGNLENPQPPKFKPKNHHATITFKRNNFKLIDKNGKKKIRLTISQQSREYLKEKHTIKSEYLWIDFPDLDKSLDKSLSLDGDKDRDGDGYRYGEVKIIEIVPLWDGSYNVHLVVEIETEVEAEAEKKVSETGNVSNVSNVGSVGSLGNVMSIDLGISNLACLSFSNSDDSFIISGSQLLAVNRYFDKEISKLQQINNLQGRKNNTKRINCLWDKRRSQVKQILHSASKEVISLANRYQVDTIVIGDLKDLRVDADYGKKTNQKLHKWSFAKFSSYIQYKAKLSGRGGGGIGGGIGIGGGGAGIRVEKVSESYSSQCCSIHLLASEIDQEHAKKSNRKERGLYCCCECGAILNADQNGSLNLLKKYLLSRGFSDSSAGKSKSLCRGVVALASPVRLIWNGHRFSHLSHLNRFSRLTESCVSS